MFLRLLIVNSILCDTNNLLDLVKCLLLARLANFIEIMHRTVPADLFSIDLLRFKFGFETEK